MKKSFSFRIASDSDREEVFAELFYGDEQWAEISKEEAKPIITLFPPSDTKFWEFPLEEAMQALEKAKADLFS